LTQLAIALPARASVNGSLSAEIFPKKAPIPDFKNSAKAPPLLFDLGLGL